MSKIINFRARSKTEFEIQTKPYPAVKSLPKWFLDADPYEHHPTGDAPNDGKVHVRNSVSNATFKKCPPLLDGMSSGYIIPLWADVEISNNGNGPFINWKTTHHIFEIHGSNTQKIQAPIGYSPQVFKYNNCWIPQTPKGYSCIVTSPFGYNDLPFKAVPAVIDTDRSTLELIFPVWVKDNFSGIVEKGTPIAQIIPFKRDDWESTFDYYEDDEYRNIIAEKNFNSTIVGHYIKNHWSKKKFK
jgi:hypothetical protein